jgi:hypothetical protein
MGVTTGLAAGRRLGSYTIERMLGRGGMSVVYAAEDRRLGRRVALKVLSPELSEREDFRARFLRESRLAASIDHPNVIPIYEAGEADDGVLFIAMRLVDGTDLRRLLVRDGPLEPGHALAIVGQAASALDAAHARGLLHRDVKPGNILLAWDEAANDHVYLSDFGLAVPGGGSLAEGSFHGTAEYVAPEQIEGRPEPRSDVYSLACVLFECLTGRPPFAKGRLLATLWSQLNDEAPRLSSVNPEFPAAADPVLAGALAKDPSERPATAGELVAEARAALGVDRFPRSRARFAAATAVLTAVTAVTLALVLVLGGDEPGPTLASEQATISTFAGSGEPGSAGDGGPAHLAQLTDPFHVAVDRTGNVYVTGWFEDRVRRITRDGTITTVAGTGQNGYSGDGGPATQAEIGESDLAVSPTGDLYMLDFWRPVLRRVDREGIVTTIVGTGNPGFLDDGPRTISPDLCARPTGPAFDSQGRIHVACSAANRIVRVERDGVFTVVAGSGVAGYSGDGGPATQAALNSPVGLAFDRDDNLYIADLYNNRVRKVDRNGIITTFAGTGRPGLSGDGWRAAGVDLWAPVAVTVDDPGNVYIVENGTHRVRKVDKSGIITTVAGTGAPGFLGDGGPATEARLDQPSDVAVDLAGNIYIADRVNQRVRKVTP